MDNMFTPSAKHVLAIAQEQAKYFKHQAVGTEHLLLALSMDKDGIANKIFLLRTMIFVKKLNA